MSNYVYTNELYHFGIKGMKWGVRRYQNEDGSLTELGKKRNATISDLRSKAEQEYSQTKLSKVQKQWRKKHPKADPDDFDDYIANEHDVYSYEDEERDSKHESAASRYRREAQMLENPKEYVKGHRTAAALVSGMILSPIPMTVAASVAPKGKKIVYALAAGGALTAGFAAISDISARKEVRSTEKKYGLR